MADEKVASSTEGKKSFPLIPVIVGVLVVVVVAVGAVFATLMLTGAMNDQELEEALAEIETPAAAAEAAAPAEGDPAVPTQPQLLVTPNPERLGTLYYEMPRPLTANINGSRKVMQVTVAVMTHYDQMVIDSIVRHELAIRSAILADMSRTPEDNLLLPDFREQLGEQLRITINAVLEDFGEFAGVESVYFTEFLVQ
jgi:flagellar FliL protein